MIPPQEKAGKSSSIEDLGKQIRSGIDKVRQYAAEKMGRADPSEVTPMPDDFAKLEGKMEDVRVLFDGVVRCTRQMLAAEDYSPPIGDQVKSAFDRLQVTAKRATDTDAGEKPKADAKPLIQDAAADACAKGAAVLADLPSTAASEAFGRYGESMRKIADARRAMAASVQTLFLEPFGTYAGAYENASKKAKAAHAARLELDNARRRLRSFDDAPAGEPAAVAPTATPVAATPTPKAEGEQPATDAGKAAAEAEKPVPAPPSGELQKAREAHEEAQTRFQAACAEAVQEMDAFVQYTEATHCLDALAKAQKDYFAAAAASL